MSLSCMDAVFKASHIQNKSEVLVLLVLANWANDEGKCFPSLTKLAAYSRHSRRGVIGVLKRIKMVYVDWDENDGGRSRSNVYYLNMDTIKNADNADKIKAMIKEANSEPGSPFSSQTVNGVHPLNSERGSPFRADKQGTPCTETGNAVPVNGERGSLAKTHTDTYLHAPPTPQAAAAAVFDIDFLMERDKPFRTAILDELPAFDPNEAGQLVKRLFEWKKINPVTEKACREMCHSYGPEIFCSAAVIAAGSPRGSNPISFIREISERLLGSKVALTRRREIEARKKAKAEAKPKTRHAPSGSIDNIRQSAFGGLTAEEYMAKQAWKTETTKPHDQ